MTGGTNLVDSGELEFIPQAGLAASGEALIFIVLTAKGSHNRLPADRF